MRIKLLSFALTVLIAFTLTSFNTNSNLNEVQTELSPNQNNWGPWKTTSCFRYLQYQIKKDDYAGKWYIRFKNGYDQSISLSIEVKGNTGTKDDSGRFTVKTGDTRSQYYFVDDNSTRIDFTVDKVKFGDTSWGGPYAECDN